MLTNSSHQKQSEKSQCRLESKHDGEIIRHAVRVKMPQKVRRSRTSDKHQKESTAIKPQRHKGTADQRCPWSVPDTVQCIIRLVPGKQQIENIDKQRRPKDASQHAAPTCPAPCFALLLFRRLTSSWPKARLHKKQKYDRNQQQSRELGEQGCGDCKAEQQSVSA